MNHQNFLAARGSSKRFTRQLHIMILALPLIAIILITTLWVVQDVHRFQKALLVNRQEMLSDHKALVRSQVHRAMDFIDYRLNSMWDYQRGVLKDRVYQVWHIAQDLVHRYRNKLEAEMKWTLFETISALSWDLVGSVFALSKAGMVMAHSLEKKESHPLSTWAGGTESVSLVLKLLDVAQNQGDGFVRYPLTGTKEAPFGPRLFYVREFKPLNWIRGAEIETERITAQIQEEVIRRLGSISFADGTGYVFINAYGGVPLLNPNSPELVGKNLWNLKDANGLKLVQKIEAAARRPKGGFVSYDWEKPSLEEPVEKLSFVQGIEEWNWAVGAGLYLDDIDAAIASERQALQSEFATRLGLMLTVMLVLGLVSIWLGRRLSRKLISQFECFQEEFIASFDNKRPLDIEVFAFTEFRQLGSGMNQILQALHESEERYQSLIEQLPVGLYRNTPGAEGRFILANSAMAQMFGYASVEEILQVSVADLYADATARKAFSQKLLAKGAVTGEELRLCRKDGTALWAAVTARVIRDEAGEIKYFDGLIEDMTWRKDQEDQLRRTLAETERMNRLMHGREVRVVEMKEEVNTLRAELGRALKYKSVE